MTPSGTAVSATSDFNKTYKINGKYTMAGKTYYALVNYTSDKLIGYISTEAMPKITKSAGGSWLSKTGYATIKKSNYNTYSDFSWKIKTKASSNYQRTYKVNGMYHHANGSTYYSIYGGSSGKWYGYINANAATVTTVKQGAVMATSGYATVTKKYDVWGSFNWTKKLSAASAYQKTYQIKNKYSYCDGRTFYSLYNGKGTWIGYINGAGVKISKNAQGTAIGASGKVKVVKHNYAIWSNFSWAKKSVTAAKSYNKTYTVKCYYNHVNGTKYDSVYSGSKWIGYINAAGVKSVK